MTLGWCFRTRVGTSTEFPKKSTFSRISFYHQVESCAADVFVPFVFPPFVFPPFVFVPFVFVPSWPLVALFLLAEAALISCSSVAILRDFRPTSCVS
ncbi:hypothetical protein F5X99DRAFT_164455 [Biscogniauxia marginata]|nr:hypothetical protein F5X99DRAFT_164455 [Biscogniauxia marginata]